MISFDEAQALLAGAVTPLGTQTVPLDQAAGRVLARPVVAALDSPRRDVSAMDGYALRSADAKIGAKLALIGQSAAGGAVAPPVGQGEAVRIFTGAALPQGADLIVIQENCEVDGDEVVIARAFGPGDHIRRKGSDYAAGSVLLAAGRRLDPLAMVTLASSDSAETDVYRRPRVALIATGDELAPPGTARANPLAIPESVSFGVAALIAEQGGDLVLRRSGGDDLPALTALAGEALAAADVVVITGGASVGDRDYAQPMFAAHGLEPLFAKVAIKPGKPVWLGRAQGKWVLGLPGNPTSAMVTARLFLTALLAALQGRDAATLLDWTQLPLAAAMPPPGDRETFARMIWTPAGLQPIGNQDSGVQGALSATTWLARRPAQAPAAAIGERVAALRFG